MSHCIVELEAGMPFVVLGQRSDGVWEHAGNAHSIESAAEMACASGHAMGYIRLRCWERDEQAPPDAVPRPIFDWRRHTILGPVAVREETP